MSEENNPEKKQETHEHKEKFGKRFEKFHDKYYKLILLIPIAILLISFIYIGIFYSKTGDIMHRDVSLSGGTTITINGNINSAELKTQLESKLSSVSITTLTDVTTREPIAVVIETSANVEEAQPIIEEILGYKLTGENSSIEFTGSTLSGNFYKQLILALVISFILMSIVIFILFRTFIPSIAVIFAVFADIVMPLALIDYFGMKVSAAGIAAFLMLVGYSVDTDILLTSRVLKNSEGSLNHRIYRSFKTGMLMNLTALAAVIPAFLLIKSLPSSFSQIFIILSLGLFADILNTWLTNVSIIKWYCEKKGIK